jgi:hypothetical protein
MNPMLQLRYRFTTVSEVFTFLWNRKLWWLIPLAVFVFVIGILFVLAQVSSVAPWMYPV